MPPGRKFFYLKPGQSLEEIRKRDGISLCEYLDYLDRLERNCVQPPPNKRLFENLSEEDIQAQEVMKKLMGGLNKLSPDNFYVHLMEIYDHIPVHSNHLMKIFMKKFIFKVIDEGLWSQLYAHLCKALECLELEDVENPNVRTFGDFLLDECFTQFCCYCCDINWWELRPPTEDDMPEILARSDRKRRSLVGLVSFLGELYNAEVIDDEIVYDYIANLRKETCEKNVEALAKLLQTCGQELESSSTRSEFQNEWIDIWESIVKMTKKESGFPSRIRFILMDLLDLMNGGWVPRFPTARPRTFVELLFDVKRSMDPNGKDKEEIKVNVSAAHLLEKQLLDDISDDPAVLGAEKELMGILKSGNGPYHQIHDWEIVYFKGAKNWFVYSLTRVLLRISIAGNTLNESIFEDKIDVLKKYVNSRKAEVACMYAVQYLVVAEMGNPKGLLNRICRALHRTSVVSYVGFLDWRENWSKTPILQIQGKAVAQVTLARFFIDLFRESIKPNPQYKSIVDELNSFDQEHFVSTSKLPPEIAKRVKMEEERAINKLKKKDHDQPDSPYEFLSKTY